MLWRVAVGVVAAVWMAASERSGVLASTGDYPYGAGYGAVGALGGVDTIQHPADENEGFSRYAFLRTKSAAGGNGPMRCCCLLLNECSEKRGKKQCFRFSVLG
jgi:hypothetical protein